MAKKNNTLLIVLGIGVLALFLGVLSLSAPYIHLDKLGLGGTTASVANVATTTSTSASGAACERPTGGNTATFGVKVTNGQNSTYQQVASTAAFIGSNGQTAGSVTTTDAAAESYASMTPLPCEEGFLYILGDGSTNGEKVAANTNKANQNVNVPGSQNTRLIFSLYTSTFGADNSSVGPESAQGSVTINSTTHDIASGGSYSGYLDVDFQSASSSWGSVDGGGIIGADHNLAVYSRENGVKFSSITGISLTPVTCPTDAATYLNVDTCWKIGQLASRTTATPARMSFTIKADLGEPGASDNVVFYFMDNQYFRDTDGFVKLGAFNSAGTSQGVADGKVTIDVS